MSFPTVLSPYFIVFEDRPEGRRFYRSPVEAGPGEEWTTDKSYALLMMSLSSAARVALTLNAEVKVIWTKEHLREFGR